MYIDIARVYFYSLFHQITSSNGYKSWKFVSLIDAPYFKNASIRRNTVYTNFNYCKHMHQVFSLMSIKPHVKNVNILFLLPKTLNYLAFKYFVFECRMMKVILETHCTH